MQTTRRPPSCAAASQADELVLRVQATFNSALHPDAIRLLSGLPSHALPHTVALLVQLGAQAYEDLRDRHITASQSAAAAPSPSPSPSPPAPPTPERPHRAAQSNPVAALVTSGIGPDVFARPSRPAPDL